MTINLAELEQYFPESDKPIKNGPYTFTISLKQDDGEETFVINLKVKQKDNKEDHHIKLRVGLGKDKEQESKTHETHKPHFEIDIYKRERDAFAATAYFTFNESSSEKLMSYAKGTLVLISKIIDIFFETHKLDKETMGQIIYKDPIIKELSEFEPLLIEALYDCYKRSDIYVRQDGKTIQIKTEHNLKKYLDMPDLAPLYLPLSKKISQ